MATTQKRHIVPSALMWALACNDPGISIQIDPSLIPGLIEDHGWPTPDGEPPSGEEGGPMPQPDPWLDGICDQGLQVPGAYIRQYLLEELSDEIQAPPAPRLAPPGALDGAQCDEQGCVVTESFGEMRDVDQTCSGTWTTTRYDAADREVEFHLYSEVAACNDPDDQPDWEQEVRVHAFDDEGRVALYHRGREQCAGLLGRDNCFYDISPSTYSYAYSDTGELAVSAGAGTELGEVDASSPSDVYVRRFNGEGDLVAIDILILDFGCGYGGFDWHRCLTLDRIIGRICIAPCCWPTVFF